MFASMITEKTNSIHLNFSNARECFFSTTEKTAPNEGLLYFSLTGEKNGKSIVIVKDNGRTIKQGFFKDGG